MNVDPLIATAVVIVIMAGLTILGLPVAFAMISGSVLGLLIFVSPAAMNIAQYHLFNNLTQSLYIAIPLFTFMASLIESSGISTDLYDMMLKWFGGLRGGLAIGTVAICTVVAAMTGLAATAVVTMGLLAYPEMKKRGYHNMIALGCIPAGGVLGPLIPPSILMIIVAGFASLSVGKLFIGGLIPGLLTAFLFIIYIAVASFIRPELAPALPPEDRANWKEKFISLRGVILPISLIILVLGGIYSGAFTPSEAGGIGSFGAIICAAIHRKLSLNTLRRSSITTLKVTVMVLWLCIAGSILSAFLTAAQATYALSNFLSGLPVHPMSIIVIMMVIVLVMGMFVD
ncbi:TRAP transporter large permease subunit, partial [Chloroflexota bacterium]